MALRIPSNVMDKPLMAGSAPVEPQADRVFGNLREQYTAMPNVPNGYGGVANPAAGAEGKALAAGAEAVGQSIQQAATYFENLRTAEEDSRAKMMFLEIEKKDAEIRKQLGSDPEHAKKSSQEQQDIYELERDSMIDSMRSEYNFQSKKIVKNVDDNLNIYKANSSTQYQEKVVKPLVVFNAKVADQKSDGIVIDTVAAEPTPENIAKAVTNIKERYDSPVAYATYGAEGVAKLKAEAQGKLQATVMVAFQDTLETSKLAKLEGVTGLVDMTNKKDGVVSALAADQLFRFKNLLGQLDIPESERLKLEQKGERFIAKFTDAAVKDHNTQIKEADKQRLERVQDMVDTWGVQLGLQARNGGLSDKKMFSSFEKLMEHPDIKDDPQAQKKLFMAMDRVSNEMAQQKRHAERLASESRTRETITQMRLDNGIAVSGAALDTAWKKNGTLKSFFEGGNVVSPAHLQEIDRAGAVPTTVVQSIQADLRSSNEQVRQRGVSNLLQIKGYSSNSQQALFKELPDGWAGVTNRLESGQTVNEALAFLTRPKNTPDIEKKLQTQAMDKKVVTVAESVLKDVDLDPSKMSTATKAVLLDQWKDAYARSGGDEKLARDLYRQDLSKNRTVGISDFSGKVELHPTRNFANKDIVSKVIEKDFPELKGKEYMPVYSGKINTTENGTTKIVPTYDIYVKGEDGLMQKVTSSNRIFYMTAKSVADVQEEVNKVQEDKLDAAAKERKDNVRWLENANNRLIEGKKVVQQAVEAAKQKQGAK